MRSISAAGVWNKTESRRDPRTGRRRRFKKAESEWIIHEDELLRIVPQELWERVRAARRKAKRSWPGGKGRRGFSAAQRGRVNHFPTHLLSSSMTCTECGSTIGQVSGKGGGYYGCLGAVKGKCENRILVRRRLAEKAILGAVQERLGTPENIHHVLKKVEEEVQKLYSHIPETIRLKEKELAANKCRVANFVDYIGEGRGSRALTKALLETERKVTVLETELQSLQRSEDKVFQAPPIEWIEERLANLRDVLEQQTQKSALVLRRLLGRIRLEPAVPETGRPYYVAHSSIDTLALIDESPGSDKGSNSLRWWRRRGSNPRPVMLLQGSLRA